jgi:hypothetical protein
MTSIEKALELETDDLSKKLLQTVHDWILKCCDKETGKPKPLIKRTNRGAVYEFIIQTPGVAYDISHDHYEDHVSFRKAFFGGIGYFECSATGHIRLEGWQLTVDYAADTERSTRWDFQSLAFERDKPVVLSKTCKKMIRDIVQMKGGAW